MISETHKSFSVFSRKDTITTDANLSFFYFEQTGAEHITSSVWKQNLLKTKCKWFHKLPVVVSHFEFICLSLKMCF